MKTRPSAFVIAVKGKPERFLASVCPLRFSPDEIAAIRLSNLAAAVKVAQQLNSLPAKDRFFACFFARAE